MTREEFEAQYEDALMNIELAVLTAWHHHPALLDLHVEAALGALISRYKAQELGKPELPPHVSGPAAAVFEAVLTSCELMLGRPQKVMDTLSLPEVLACLARIRKSVRFWAKQRGGGRAYLSYIASMLEDPNDRFEE